MPGFVVGAFEDATDFASTAVPYLEQHPVEATVLATVLAEVTAGARSYPGAVWLSVDHSGEVVGVAMQTPPHALWLSPMPDPAAAAVAETMASRLAPGQLPGINGEERAVEAARQRWNLLRPDEEVRPTRRERLYLLDTLVAPVGVPGSARRADSTDLDLLAEWWVAFCAEADVLPSDPREVIPPRLRGHGALHVWEVAGDPVAMAGHTVPAAGTVRVGPVYTPPDLRRRGYGAAVTAATTRHALDDAADRVVLFTDLANPVSNSVYQRIGYRPVRDYVEMDAVQERGS